MATIPASTPVNVTHPLNRGVLVLVAMVGPPWCGPLAARARRIVRAGARCGITREG